jgi:hypothetical protein
VAAPADALQNWVQGSLALGDLKALSEEKRAVQEERDTLRERIADQAQENQRVRNLAACAATVSANLDVLTSDERRMALDAYGAQVRVYRPGAVDGHGQLLPRWTPTLDPGIVMDPSLVSRSTHRTRGASSWSAASWP